LKGGSGGGGEQTRKKSIERQVNRKKREKEQKEARGVKKSQTRTGEQGLLFASRGTLISEENFECKVLYREVGSETPIRTSTRRQGRGGEKRGGERKSRTPIKYLKML